MHHQRLLVSRSLETRRLVVRPWQCAHRVRREILHIRTGGGETFLAPKIAPWETVAPCERFPDTRAPGSPSRCFS
eukprot:scaffold26403_cov95-Phaeocystis_antarctica.AAC.1